VLFDALTSEDLARIVEIQLERLNRRLAGRRITVEVSEAARLWLGEVGFDPIYGARPLRRLVQSTLEDQLARGLLSGEIHDGENVRFDKVGDGVGIV
jgi:ATP-dependent Clp protease ATP-binding subunit ClpB